MFLEDLLKVYKLYPNDIVLEYENEKISYDEIIKLSKKVANKLKGLNVNKNDFVTVEIERNKYYVAALIGTWMRNAAFAALDSSYPNDRLDFIASDCNAKVRINNEFFNDINSFEEIDKICYPNPNDYSLLVYTSGSTGRPKGVLHTHLSVHDMYTRGDIGLNSDNFKRKGQILGLPIPLSFVAGLSTLFGSMIDGVITYIIPYVALKDPMIMSKIIYENNISIAYIPPKMINVFENKGNTLKLIITGSEKLANTYRDDITIVNCFGSSETGGGVTFFYVDKKYDNTPIGNTVGKEKIYVLDDDLNEVEEGEMCIAGNLASGYFNLPEQTAKQFIPNPFESKDGFKILYKTGDIVKRIENNNLVYLNRKDWMIKINGLRVEPGEIESIIRKSKGIKDVVVKDFIGAAGQTYIVAYYTTIDNKDINEEDIKAIIKDNLPDYMMPKYFVKLDKLPLNANGKLDRKALMTPEINEANIYVEPKDDIEKELCQAFEKALNISRVGIKDDFFTLGGDSIRVMVLEQLCPNLNLSTKLIYEKRTVELIAKDIRNNEENENLNIDIYNDSFPLNQAQLGIFLSCESREGEIAYNNPILLRFNPDVDEIKLQKAIEKTVDNHPGLLATYYLNDSGLPQMKYNKEFLKEEICPIKNIKEKEFEDIKNNLVRPFLIKKDRLFRFSIFKTKDNLYLFMDIHHIIFDGYSMRIILPEIIDTYFGKEALKEKFSAFHANLEENKERESKNYNKSKEWYLKTFGEIEEISLPQGDINNNETTFSEYKASLKIDLNKLKNYCLDNQITENSITCAAFGKLLSIYTMNKNAAFATVYNGRHDLKTANTISMFVRTLPVLCINDPKLSVIDYIKNVKNQMLEAMVNDIYSFRELSSESGYNSDILFTYQGDLFEIPNKWLSIGAKGIDLPFNATGEKLSIQIYPLNNELVLDIQYHSNIYSEKWIKDFANRYEIILNAFLNEKYLKDISLVNKEEIKKILEVSYGGTLEYDKNKTFVDIFKDIAKKYSNKTAVVDYNSKYTYKELDLLSNKIANHLINHGVKCRDFVAIKIRRIKEFYAAIIGIQKAGAAYIPVDPTYPSDRIEYMINDSNAAYVLTEEIIKEIENDNISNKEINLANPDNPAYMIYTSGSTGKPKGVVLPHKALVCFLAWATTDYDLDENSKSCEHASFSFDASVFDIFPPLAVGAEVHIISDEVRKDLDLTYQYIVDNKITSGCMSTQIGMSLINAHPDIPLKFINIGGEKFLQVAKTNVKLYNGYGPTEFTVCSSYQVVDQDSDKDIPIGKAVKNTYSFICDLNGNLLPLGMVGEICLAGPQISDGYYNRDELNKERFIDCKYLPGMKMYRTGDLAKYNNDGVLEYLGRIDFQVKLRGFRIELGEIENAASNYPNVKQTIALVKNKLLVLYYSGEGEIDEAKLKAHMSSSLTEYMVPNIFVRLEKMPLTPGGKIDRRALPEPEIGSREIVMPKTDDEKKIYEILSKILGYNDFGITDDFKEIGLTSLSAMQLSSVLSSTFKKSIRVSDLVKYSTIEMVGDFISKKENETVYKLMSDYPLTMAQHGILTEVLAHPDTTVYNLPFVIDLPKDIDLDMLIIAIKKVINAHPYLKGRIISNEKGEFKIKRNDEAPIDIKQIEYSSLKNGVQELVKPFNILTDALVRAYIITGAGKNQFFFDAHHIIFDGESLDVFMRDLNDAYQGKDLIKETYTEYELALDENKLHQSDALADAMNHYTSLLDGKDVDCLLVNDISTNDVIKKSIGIDVNIDKNKVLSYLKENKTTINSLWISALGYTLAKYLNRDDAIFATVYNGRNDSRVKDDIGMFVHTLPIVCEPFKSKTFKEYVKETANQIQNSMAHDIYSFLEIAHDFGVRTDVLFVYEGKIAQGYKLGNLDIPSINTLAISGLKAELLIAVNDREDGFNVFVEYNGSKYENWSIESFINSFALVFNSIIDNKNINELSLLSKTDIDNLEKYNDIKKDIILDDIVSEFNNSVKKYPNNTAIIYKDKKLTYKEVDEITNKIAFNLATKGIKKGAVVSILTSRNENMILSALGALKTGAAYQPLDHSYPSDRLNYMISDANASILIAEEDLLEKIPDINLPILLTKDFNKLNDKPIKLTGPTSDDLFILLYTSGTTGMPKGVMLSHKNLVNFCSWYRNYYKLTPNSVHSAYAGFGFDACMLDLYPALTTGAAVCIVPDELRMNLDQLAKYFIDNNVSHSFMTTQVGRLFATENEKSSLKYLSVGGEKLTPLNPPHDYDLYNGYGPTECTIFSTVQLVDKLYCRIPIGRPLDNYKLYVVDKFCKELPNGALGELWIAGYGVGLGYLNLPEKTKEAFINNPFTKEKGYERAYRTGDIVRRLNDGSIDFIGRNDGQVKIRGFRIELSEVEMAIRSFEGIKDVTVQAFDLEGGGKFLAAYFTSDQKIDIDKIREHIKADKPAYMVPASIMQLDSIPLNQNQKVNKRALPKPVFNEERSEFIEPKNEIERDFCNAYKEILGIDKVSANDSFFEIGGSSLTAAKVVIYALNRGYQITYQDIFNYPSPIELALYVSSSHEQKEDNKEFVEDDNVRQALQYNDISHVDEIKIDRPLGHVLLAGATGFLGIHIFKELLDKEIDVTILVRSKDISPIDRIKALLMYYFDSPLDDAIDNHVKVINADITDVNLTKLLKDYEFDTIINSAAVVKHFASDDSIERVNVGGVKNLIELALIKNARLVHISTISVAGENVGHKFPDNFKIKENQLYFGQDLSNKYANSKFMAEQAILDAVEKRDLDAKIIRVGNLMSRQKDGEFQANSVTNAFMRNLKAYKVLKKFPISLLDESTDFSPIDETAKTVLLLGQVPKKFTVFHSFNSHTVQMGDVIEAMNLAGIPIECVKDGEFMLAVKEAMQDEKKSMIVSSLLSYNSNDNLTHEFIQGDSKYTVKALYRLGYRWPITDFNYLTNAIKALDSLEFFDRDDM